MKRLISALFLLAMLCPAMGQNIRNIIQTNDILTAQQQPKRVGWWQGETIQYDVYVERDGAALSLSTGSTFAVWYVTSTSSLSLQYIVNTGILANATNGHVRITATASEANLATGTYFSSVRLYDVSGGVTANVGTVARGLADVYWSPDFASYSIVTGQVVTTLVFNVTINGATNSGAGSITNIISSNAIIGVTGGAGPQTVLNINTSSLSAALSGIFATGTPLYVEADTQAIAQVWAASNALKILIGLNATNIGTANTTATNLQGQITTNLTGRGLIGSNLLVVATYATNIDGRVTTNLTAQGLIQSNLLVVATYTTNIEGRVTTNLTRLGLLETNHLGLGVSVTNAFGAISTNLTRLGALETNHLALGVIVTNLQGAVTTNLSRLGALETNHLGLGVSVTNVDGRVTTNLSAQGLIATNLTQVGLVLTNLSVLVTTNYVAQGLLNTNHIATGLAITNLQGLVSSNHLADGVTQTNLQGQITTNLVAAGLIRTNLTQVGLVVTNLQGLVTTNYTAQGLVQSNLSVVAAQVTNNLAAQGLISTNLATLTTNAVVRDTTSGQEMAGALHSRDRLSASTNLIVAATNAAGSEVLNNGTFTGSEAGWSLTNASYNANNILVLPSATASITYTQAVVAARHVYQLSFANTLAYGSNFTLFAVSLGGWTNTFPYAPTGTTTLTIGTHTDQPLAFRATPGTNQLVLDTVSLKEDLNGDLWFARRMIGHDAYLAESLTASNVTVLGTISGVVRSVSIQNIFNTVSGVGAVSVGGSNNVIAGDYGVIGGGLGNSISNNVYQVIGGGVNNTILATDQASVIAGGEGNVAAGYSATVAGGNDNRAYGSGASVGGGFGGAASNDYATVSGGTDNRAHGANSTIPGGYQNAATMTDSFAAGRKAKATNQGAFVWADGTDTNYSSHGSHTFNIRPNGGVWVSESQVFDGSGSHMGNGANLTNLTAANLAAGGTFPALNAANLTNLPSAAATAGVNSLVLDVTNSFTANVDFDDSAEVDAYMNGSNGVSWLIQSASIVSSKLASAVWDGIEARYAARIGTTNGSVTSAQIQDSSVTSQKMAAAVWDQIASMGGSGGTTNASGINVELTPTNYAPANASAEGHAIGIDQALGSISAGGTGKLYRVAGISTPEVTFSAGANMSITTSGTDIAFASTASGGGGSAFTNYLEISEGTNCPAPIFAVTNGIWSFVMITNVARSSGNLASIYNGSTWDFNLPDSNRLYGISLEGDIGSATARGLTIGIFINGTNNVFYPGHERLNTPDPSMKIFSGGINLAGGPQSGHVETRETQVGIKTNGTLVRVMILPTATFSFYSIHLYIRDLGPAPTYREPGGWSAGW